MPSQAGKRILVTGGTGGLGWQAALGLARGGASVTLTARTEAKGRDAVARILAAAPGVDIRFGVLDLSSMASVRVFAAEELLDGRPIDVLIHNAGVMAIRRRTLSEGGYEMQFATNVLGPFALAGLLLPRILAAPAPRVITVSSSVHGSAGPLQMDNLNSERSYHPLKTYAQTKLINALYGRELQRRAGSKLLSLIVHPGYAKTDLLFRDPTLMMKVLTFIFWSVSQSAAQGAWPILYAATGSAVKPGAYYGPDKLGGIRGNVSVAPLSKPALDQDSGKTLFSTLERISSVTYAL